jgi:hypothetical protein
MCVILRTLAIALALSVSAFAAQAQQWPRGWGPVGNTVSLSVSNASSNVQLGWAALTTHPQPPQSVVVCNQSTTVTAYVTLGFNNAVTATTSTGFPVLPSYCGLLFLDAATYLAGITASSSATLLISSGTGLPFAALPRNNGGGGGGGGILLTGGTDLLTVGTDLATQ